MNSTQNDGSQAPKKPLRVRKKERTKQAILDAAEALYSEKPLDEVFLEDVAEAAFVSRTTIYNYFKNKDDVYFAMGNRIINNLNNTIAAMLPADLSGKDQVLWLCEKTFHDSIDQPIFIKIVREFFDHLNSKNLSPVATINEITEKLGLATIQDLVDDLSLLDAVDFAELFDEPYLIEYFIQHLRLGHLWTKALNKGKQDHTIKNDLEAMQIIQFVNMLLHGIIYEMELRRMSLDRIDMKRETIVANSMHLISIFLDKNV